MKPLIFDRVYDVFAEYMKGRGLSSATIHKRSTEYRRFSRFCQGSGIDDIRDIPASLLETYVISLAKEGLSSATQRAALAMIRDLFYCLALQQLLVFNPMDHTDIYIREENGVRSVFSEKEVVRFLDAIRPTTGYGLRDRTIFELMYGSGLRSGEVLRLDIEDVDCTANELMIKNSKNNKDRVVPIGQVSKELLTRWITTARAWFQGEAGKGALFINKQGKRLAITTLLWNFRKYVKEAGITTPGLVPHSLRHSCATHLLLHGADIRYVQELLGHVSLETTVLYTREIVTKLKTMHKTHHPRENELYSDTVNW